MRFVPVVNHISAGVRVNYQACVKDTVTGSTYRIDPLGEAVNFYSLSVAESASEKRAADMNKLGRYDRKFWPNMTIIA